MAARTSVVLALAFLPLLAAPARADDERPAQEARDAAQEGREARRILHLHGGTTVRAITRAAEGGWEYRAGREWRSIPEGAIARVVPEKEALAELRKRRASTGSADRDARAELAAWMYDEGLLEEAIAETDALLALEREHERVREIVVANAFRFQRPRAGSFAQDPARALDEVLRAGAEAGPSVREMIAADLAQVEPRESLRDPLQRALFDGSLRSRSFAALALRRVFPGEEVRPLLNRAVMDTSEEVRVEAALALRAANEPALVVPVARAMTSSLVPAVRRNAAEALGNMGYSAAVPALASRLASMQGATSRAPHSNIFIGRQFAYLQDFDVEVAQFQAVADPQINVLLEGQATDAGVIGVQEVQFASERRVIQSSLARLTGEDPGNYARDWLEWWDEHGSAWTLEEKPRTGDRR